MSVNEFAQPQIGIADGPLEFISEIHEDGELGCVCIKDRFAVIMTKDGPGMVWESCVFHGDDGLRSLDRAEIQIKAACGTTALPMAVRRF